MNRYQFLADSARGVVIDQRALGGTHRLGVVTVGEGTSAAYEGSTVVDGRLASSQCDIGIGSIERVGDIHLVAVSIPTNETTAQCSTVGGQQTTVVYAARDIHTMVIAPYSAHEAAVAAVTVHTAVNDGADMTVSNVRRTFYSTNNSCG